MLVPDRLVGEAGRALGARGGGWGRPATTPLERAAAAVPACGSRAALSHFSALALWGFGKDWPQTPEVTIFGDRRPPGIVVHRTRHRPRRDLRIQLGIRVTSPARTLLECAPGLAEKPHTRIVNQALHTPFLRRSQLSDVVQRYPTHPGSKLLRPFVDTTDGRPGQGGRTSSRRSAPSSGCPVRS